MNWPKRSLRVSIVIALCFTAALTARADLPDSLTEVGSARLKVFFWTIYDCYLYSNDGIYRGLEPNLTLRIDYRRRIGREDLVDRTRLEWQKQGLYSEATESWLDELTDMWPDVEKGDQFLMQVTEQLASRFLFNGQEVGSISNPDFTERFLAIWLSEKSSYPEQRKQLLGIEKFGS
ncbi:MAG: chalcone isomerase family protein [Gammaproteobacteria bacterium]|nr:chalcone isomerase family protein [Gammaproteobacteria bacterium]